MAIGIVSDEDFNTEVDRADRSPVPELKPAQIINNPRPGRSEGDINVPDSIQKLIIDEKVVNGRSSALGFAKMMGVSPSSVSAYSVGATSTTSYNNPKNKLSNALKESKNRIARRASGKLNLALKHITPEKLENADLKDLALVAKSMSGIIKDMDPPTANENGGNTFNGPSIVMYNPGFAKEDSFDTVNIEEQ